MEEFNFLSDEYFMKQALVHARTAFDKGEVPIGAIIVHNGRIVARAHNMTETLCDATAHAEMQAITAAENSIGGKYLKDCVLYVTVEPCVMCAGASYWSQISKIVYGASDQKRGYSRFGKELFHPTTQIVNGILEKECRALMTDFFLSLRKN
jgi:tRNA(adenine34) deaminase